jgi:ketosteroid isomerase-like protein
MNDVGANVETLRHAYALWNDTRGASVPMWLELMAADVVIRSLGGGRPGLEFGRERYGKDEAERYFAELAADWEMIHFTVETFVAQADRVVVLSRVAYRFRATGKEAVSRKADVFRFRDGEIVEVEEFFDTAAAFAATQPG